MATVATTARNAQNGTRGQGRGRVLAAAFDEAERQPALQEAREQALEQVARGAPPHEVAAVVEADVGLTCAIVRAAGQLQGGGRIRSVTDAVERLGPGAVEAILRSAPSLRHLQRRRPPRPRARPLPPARPRRAAGRRPDRRDERVSASATSWPWPRSSTTSAVRSWRACIPATPSASTAAAATPDDRIAEERRELGIDHALVGGVLTRRWGVHAHIAEAIERHPPASEADGRRHRAPRGHGRRPHRGLPRQHQGSRRGRRDLRLGRGRPCAWFSTSFPRARASRRRATGPVRSPPASWTCSGASPRARSTSRSPQELDLSASTVRSHLHNVYGKLGALDRAQAVLMATEQGWI